MLIVLYLIVVNVLVPRAVIFAEVVISPIMVMVIMLAGMVMLFGAVGLRISNNLAATIVGGMFRIIGYFGQLAIRATGWCIRSIVRFLPRVYVGSRRMFESRGMNLVGSNLLSLLITLIVLVIII